MRGRAAVAPPEPETEVRVAVVAVCCALLAAGLATVVRWGGADVAAPTSEDRSPSEVTRRYLWWVALAFYTAVGSALLSAGPAARLAMRLLAVTAGPAAQGRLTEADAVVGRITPDGTLAIFVFVGVFAGVLSAPAYLVVRRWLPRAAVGGAAFGGALLVAVGTRIEPLRADNIDFAIVGPGWVAVVTFVSMALVHGAVVAALAAGISRVLPLPAARWRAALPYVPLVLLVPTGVGIIAVAAGFVVALSATRFAVTERAIRSRAYVVAGRIAVALVVLVAAPGFVTSVADIATR